MVSGVAEVLMNEHVDGHQEDAVDSTEGLTTPTDQVLAVVHRSTTTSAPLACTLPFSGLAERVAELVVERLAVRGLKLSARMATPPSPSTGWISVAETARRLDRHPDTVREDLRAGRLPGVKVGRSWRVKINEIDRHLTAAADADHAQREERQRIAMADERQRARAAAARAARKRAS